MYGSVTCCTTKSLLFAIHQLFWDIIMIPLMSAVCITVTTNLIMICTIISALVLLYVIYNSFSWEIMITKVKVTVVRVDKWNWKYNPLRSMCNVQLCMFVCFKQGEGVLQTKCRWLVCVCMLAKIISVTVTEYVCSVLPKRFLLKKKWTAWHKFGYVLWLCCYVHS